MPIVNEPVVDTPTTVTIIANEVTEENVVAEDIDLPEGAFEEQERYM